jgi:hypothetical protein
MGETSDQIERHIQETRNDLGDNFSELEEKVKMAVDWRAQFEERPGTMLAIAFGGGVLLSALLPSLSSTRRRTSDVRRNARPDRDAMGNFLTSNTPSEDNASQPLENWDALKGALVGVATSKLSAFVEELLPGFKQEFTKVQTGRTSNRSGSSTTGQPTLQKSASARAD